MKRIFTILISVLLTASVFAQSPEKMSYQAVVRDAANALVGNSAIGMQISILQGTSSGTAVYIETQTPTSNANGLVSLEIGSGTVVSGTFSAIDWANGPYFVKTETDPTGGTTYTITGTSELLSVPYALHAKNSDSWTVNGDSTYTFNNVGIGTIAPLSDLHIQNQGFANILLESTGSVEDGSIWIKNPNKTWRLFGDQSGGDKFRLDLWSDYPQLGGSNLLNAITFDTIGHVGIGTTNPSSKLHINAGDNNGVIISGGANPWSANTDVFLQLSEGPTNHGARLWLEGNGNYFSIQSMLNGNFTDVITIPYSAGGNNVGIGTISPQRKLHISDVMRLEPRNTVPSSASAGDIYFSSTTNKLMVYDGSTWQACW